MTQETMHPVRLENVAVILVEPQSPGNIGMVCRAMANFGVSDLRLVNPCAHLHPDAVKFAVFARPLLGSARHYPDLASALADLPLAVATTRRGGKLRGEPLDISALPQLRQTLPAGARIGLVFGREDAGLTTDEIACCSHTATITSVAATGSLNLAQAVLLFLYELARPAAPLTPAPHPDPPSLGEMEELFREMEGVLTRIAFLNPAAPAQNLIPLRQLMHRATPDRSEVALLRSLWTQLAWSINDWRGRKRGTVNTTENNGKND